MMTVGPPATKAASRLVRRLAASLRKRFDRVPATSGGADPAAGEGLLVWGRRYLPPHFRCPPSTMHEWLADELHGFRSERGRKLNLIGPRGGAKSTVVTLAYVLRSLVEQAEPYVWIVSDTRSQAESHLENLKTELTANQQLAAAYPHAVGRGRTWRRGAIESANGVVVEAFGVGQHLRGRRRRENRPTLIVCDDLQNESHILSARRRESSHDWFHGALLKAGSASTNVVNLATALHRDALAMRLHETPGWKSRRFQSILQWPSNRALWREWEAIYSDAGRPDANAEARDFFLANREAMEAGAAVLWPAREDLYTLMQMRLESGTTAFEREKQSSPVDPDKCEWPESYFGDELWFDAWPRELRLRAMAIDPSKGADARQGDYSAIVLLGVDAAGVLHIEADLARRPTPRMVADGVSRYLDFRPDAFGVEANQWQQLLAAEFVAEFQRRGVLGVSPCEIHNHTNKAVRIRRLGPYLSQRRLRFRRGCASTRLLVDQLRDFPLGAHDDGPDALEMALRLAEEVWQGQRETDGLGDRLPLG